MDTLSGEATVTQFIFLHLFKVGNKLLFLLFFPFKIRLILKGVVVQKSKQEVTKVVSLCKYGGKYRDALSHLRPK